jgi:hypothetical protein
MNDLVVIIVAELQSCSVHLSLVLARTNDRVPVEWIKLHLLTQAMKQQTNETTSTNYILSQSIIFLVNTDFRLPHPNEYFLY